jgi:hypothetical protein
MIRQRAGRQVGVGRDRGVDRPGFQDVAHLQHEIPVDAVPSVLEKHETRHDRPNPPSRRIPK